MSHPFRAILVASALLKLALALIFGDLKPHYDEFEFLEFGRRVLAGQGPVLWRAPGYQLFVAAGLALAGGKVVGVRVLEALVSCGTPFLTYKIGRDRWGERAGLAAGAFTALAPSSVAFSHLLWSECLYTLLVVVAFALLLSAGRTGRVRAALGTGLVLGGAVLTRSVGFALVAASIAWLVLAKDVFGRRLVLAGAVALGAALVVAPYSLWATTRAGHVVVTDTNSGFNLWLGNDEYIPSDLPSLWAVGLPLDNGTGLPLADGGWQGVVAARMQDERVAPPEFDAWYRRHAVDYLTSHPAAALLRLPTKAAALWAPDFFLPRHLLRDWYGALSPGLVALLVLATWVAAAVPLLLGPGCLALLPSDPFRSLAGAWILAYLGAHLVTYGHSRMHEPLVPLLVLAVAGCATGFRAIRAKGSLARGIVPAALALAAWIHIVPLLGGLYLMPGPRHAGFARMLAAARHLPLHGSERLAWMLAGVEEAAGRPREAERVLSEPAFAGLPWSVLLRGVVAERDGRPRDAAGHYERALAASPGLYDAALGLGRVRLALGERAGAVEALERAVSLRPWEREARDLLTRAEIES